MVILGIDPGTAITGYGAVRYAGSRCRALGFGSIRTAAKTPEQDRLQVIYQRTQELISAYEPEAVCIERLFFNKNVRTALAVGQARGVVMLAAAQHGIPVFEYTPAAVKAAVTGQGRAPKEQVGYMVRALLALDEVPRPDDVADALAVAICHALRGKTEQALQAAYGSDGR